MFRSTKDFYEELNEIGRREVAAAEGIMLGRYNRHHAAVFHLNVGWVGFDAAVTDDQIYQTQRYEVQLNAVNAPVSPESIERKADAMCRSDKDAEVAEMKARAKQEGWTDGDILLARIKINIRYKDLREKNAERIKDGMVKRLIRNCGDNAAALQEAEYRQWTNSDETIVPAEPAAAAGF